MTETLREAISADPIERDARSDRLGRASRAGAPHARRYDRLCRQHSRPPGVAADTRRRRARFRAELPRAAADLDDVYREFADYIAPYATGNVHPGFMGWVNGGGTAVGMLAEMLAAGLNANLGGRDHIPIEVERQIVDWMRQMFGFPARARAAFSSRARRWPT